MKETRFLSGRKSIVVMILAAMLIFSACGTGAAGGGVADAVELGLIMSPDVLAERAYGQELEIVEAVVQDLIIEVPLNPVHAFLRQRTFFYDHGGTLEFVVEEGTIVREGDVLGHIPYAFDVSTEMELFLALQRQHEFEENFEEEYSDRREAINNARAAGNMMLVRQLETSLEGFLLRSYPTLEAHEATVERLMLATAGYDIIAPFDGVVSWVRDQPNSLSLQVLSLDDYVMTINIMHSANRDGHFDLLGRGDILTLRSDQLRDDPDCEDEERPRQIPMLEFDVQVVTDSWAVGGRNVNFYVLRPMDPVGLRERLIEIDPEEYPGMTLVHQRLRAETEVVLAINAVTVPVEAVHFAEYVLRVFSAYVFVYNDGNIGRRYVQVGAQTRDYIEILSGLEAGAKVVIMR